MKKGKILFIFLFFVLFAPKAVLADSETVTCSDIRSKYNEYMGIVGEYNSLNCDTVEDVETFEVCKTLVYKKYSKIEDLYSLTGKNDSCGISEVDNLLNDNGDVCSNSLSSSVKNLSDTVMNFFYIIAPFLLIIFGSLDFFKIIVNGDPKTIQKNRSNFFKRVIAFVLLYFTPFIVKQIISLSVYDLDGDRYVCEVAVSAPSSVSEQTNQSRILYSGIFGIDNSQRYDSEASMRIVEGAREVSEKWAREDYSYSTGVLVYGNIKGSIDSPYRTTCCATLAAAALYKSGLISEAEINSIGYNGAYYIAELLDKKNWIIIDKYSDLKPGDVVFMTSSGGNAPITLRNGKRYDQGHVQIYAGNGKWYNAGGDDSIKGTQPSTQSDDYARSRFSFAFRTPTTTRANTRSLSTNNE